MSPVLWMNALSGDFPIAEEASRERLSLSLYSEMTEVEVAVVTDAIQKVLGKEAA